MGTSSPPPSLSLFAAEVFASGQAVVLRGDLSSLPEGDEQALDKVLSAAFATAMNEMPGGIRPGYVYQPLAASAALKYLYRLCQALVDRSMEDEEVRRLCAATPEPPATADEMLSVDLSLRHLPEIYRLARSASESDPLVSALEHVAVQFSLSTVGIPPCLPPEVSLLQADPHLWQLYLDRILERQDDSRLIGPDIGRDIRNVLGLHDSLAPRLAAKLALLGF